MEELFRASLDIIARIQADSPCHINSNPKRDLLSVQPGLPMIEKAIEIYSAPVRENRMLNLYVWKNKSVPVFLFLINPVPHGNRYYGYL